MSASLQSQQWRRHATATALEIASPPGGPAAAAVPAATAGATRLAVAIAGQAPRGAGRPITQDGGTAARGLG